MYRLIIYSKHGNIYIYIYIRNVHFNFMVKFQWVHDFGIYNAIKMR